MHPRLIAIIGPTASGKSALGIRLARRFQGEIVSADARQVYRGLDLGSGKVAKAEQRTIPHHLLDVENPRQVYTVAHFIRDAKRAVREIVRRGHLPIIVGGTGFWLDALLRGQSLPVVPPNPILRRRLAKFSASQLYTKLKRLDPRRAKAIDRHNPVRLIRALEIVLTTKKPVPVLRRRSPYEVLWLGLRPPPLTLRRNIRRRLHKRLRAGLIAEVRRLLQRGVPAQRLLDLGLEYRYVTLHLQKKLTKAEMLEQLERAIRQYAKRQMTWLKKNPDIHWLPKPTAATKLIRPWLTN